MRANTNLRIEKHVKITEMRTETDKARLEQLMVALGRATRGPGAIYLTGGASAILLAWRKMTVDVDMKLDPEPAGIFDALPKLKDDLDINIELAAPDDFIPPLPDWKERSVFIARYGEIDFYHYDFYSQALSKIERFHTRDQTDITHMIESNLVSKARLFEMFEAIESDLKRFPAIDPGAFRSRVEWVTGRA